MSFSGSWKSLYCFRIWRSVKFIFKCRKFNKFTIFLIWMVYWIITPILRIYTKSIIATNLSFLCQFMQVHLSPRLIFINTCSTCKVPPRKKGKICFGILHSSLTFEHQKDTLLYHYSKQQHSACSPPQTPIYCQSHSTWAMSPSNPVYHKLHGKSPPPVWSTSHPKGQKH